MNPPDQPGAAADAAIRRAIVRWTRHRRLAAAMWGAAFAATAAALLDDRPLRLCLLVGGAAVGGWMAKRATRAEAADWLDGVLKLPQTLGTFARVPHAPTLAADADAAIRRTTDLPNPPVRQPPFAALAVVAATVMLTGTSTPQSGDPVAARFAEAGQVIGAVPVVAETPIFEVTPPRPPPGRPTGSATPGVTAKAGDERAAGRAAPSVSGDGAGTGPSAAPVADRPTMPELADANPVEPGGESAGGGPASVGDGNGIAGGASAAEGFVAKGQAAARRDAAGVPSDNRRLPPQYAELLDFYFD